ncbi:hypothetical protein AG1IA_04778 [Rhizoctonia solani AG-1 IA]|uniref:Uncharacterized protein n=1 Tax=Thanatephorus cucumeris (strain AG1-IA) TaxID=983506 RepID=L8WWH7_THACA|nr:hypothetical protein AG1IA_04778 [Rhizoctonia solani AG-1 IA]
MLYAEYPNTNTILRYPHQPGFPLNAHMHHCSIFWHEFLGLDPPCLAGVI